jgi:hypothetical protein
LVLKLLEPKDGRCELSIGDTNWVYLNAHLDDWSLFAGLVDRRFSNPDYVLSSSEASIRVAQLFAESAYCTFERSSRDKGLYAQLIACIPKESDVSYAVSIFADLFRGFSQSAVEKEEQRVEQNLNAFEKEITEAVEDNANRRRSITLRLKGRGRPRWVLRKRKERLLQDYKKIVGLREQVEEWRDMPRRSLALKKLVFSTIRRRDFGINCIYEDDDFLRVRFELQKHRQENLDFPLRFKKDMVLGIYLKLREQWLKGASIEAIVNAYAKHCEAHSSEAVRVIQTIRDEYSEIADQLPQDRSQWIVEIESAEHTNSYRAITLLGSVLIEGLLWDFAQYLNRRGYRIYKPTRLVWPRGLAYKFNDQSGDVMFKPDTHKGIVDKKAELKTGRDLLGKSRLGYFLPDVLQDYINNEIFDGRNCYAHADIADRNASTDAALVAYCLQSLVAGVREWITNNPPKCRQ